MQVLFAADKLVANVVEDPNLLLWLSFLNLTVVDCYMVLIRILYNFWYVTVNI